jgi:ankyrin repeat protein
MFCAVELGHLNIVSCLVENGGANAETATIVDGMTAFGLACAQNHLHIVKYMVEKCTVRVNRWGRSPICLASEHGHLSIVKYLAVKAEADIYEKCRIKGYGYISPLEIATTNKHIHVMDYLSKLKAWDKLEKQRGLARDCNNTA